MKLRLLAHHTSDATADGHLNWYVGGLLVLSLVPALIELPVAVTLLVLVAFILRPLVSVKPIFKMALVALLAFGWIACVQLGERPWLSGQTFLSGVILAFALKWVESGSRSEYKLLCTGSLILFAVSSLYFSGFAALTYLILGLMGYLFIQLLIDDESRSQRFGARAGNVGALLALALPIAVVMFVTVPRIQGPLWDLGIVMGLPIEVVADQEKRLQGFQRTLQAGKVTSLKTSDEPILVAEFKGAVPYKSRLYWRGPVYDHYDGVVWSQPENWDNRSKLLQKAFRKKADLDQVVTYKKDLVSYEARISANGERWMYGLDFPYGNSPETFISNDFQVLGIRKLTQEFNYQQHAYLEYSGGRSLTDVERARYLQLPTDSNRRLQSWGQELALQFENPVDRLHALQVHLAETGYQLTQTPDIEEYKDSLDEFFFDRRVGGIEHLAGASALVLRSAGIPTRVISGYRGGSLIALTNFVVVRQAHAHVWLETWDEKLGWQRVETKDFVAPPTPEERAALKSAVKKQQSVTKPKVTTQAAKAPSSEIKAPEKKKTPVEKDSGTSWLRDLSSGLETWILNYDPERQVELMKKSGLRTVDWKSLLAVSLLSLLVLVALYGLILNQRKSKGDTVELLFERLNKLLLKKGLQCHAQECPQQWLVRLQKEAGEIYPALEVVVSQYIRLRYIESNPQQMAARTKELNKDIKRLAGMI